MRWREDGPADAPVVLLLHGFPSSSYVWRHALPAIAAAGWRAVAPDLHGFGASEPFPDAVGTWTDHVDALDAFVAEHDLAPLVLVAHDWGGLIGLRWACERPYALRGLVVTGTGFFPDGRWHGLAQGLRTPGEGERIMDAITRDAFGLLMRTNSPGATEDAIDEYFRCVADERRRAAALELYRSGDFGEIERYAGCLARLDVPALVLWGEHDQYAPLSGAHRFVRELPAAELVVVDGTGHFLPDDAPGRVAAEVVRFLARVR